jgi:hypothetical protein
MPEDREEGKGGVSMVNHSVTEAIGEKIHLCNRKLK